MWWGCVSAVSQSCVMWDCVCALRLLCLQVLKRIKKEDLATKREPCCWKQVYSTLVCIKWRFYCWKQPSTTSQKRKPTLIRNDIEVNAEKSASNILLDPFLSLTSYFWALSSREQVITFFEVIVIPQQHT